MRTTKDLRWIWEDEEQLLEPDPLGDLVAGPPEDQAEEDPGRPPRRRRLRRKRAVADEQPTPAPAPRPEPEPPQEPERPPVQPEPEPEPAPEVPPVRGRRRRIGAWSRGARFWGVVVLALVVGTVAPQLIELSTGGGGGSGPGAPPVDQQVVVWSVTGRDGDALLAVLARGRKPPVALALPDQVTINLPGQSLGTIEEAADSGPGLVEVAVENLLGVPVDRLVSSDADDLALAVDTAGGIDVLDQRMTGGQVVAYLAEPGEDAPVDAVFLRWQDVLDGLLATTGSGTAAAAGLPEPLDVMTANASFELTALPVIDIGGGLLRPEPDELEELVAEHFVLATTRGIRLVVLNGVGEPGIGQEIARVLVPEGFRLVSSGNATSFDFKETLIVAGSHEDIANAQRARALLGVGEVLVGDPPSGFTDVTVVVGRDFGGS